MHPKNPTNVSSSYFEKLRRLEGQGGMGVLTAYQDEAGVWTIGYGATQLDGKPVKPGDTLGSETDAQTLLRSDLCRYVSTVYRSLTQPVVQCQFDALVDLCYNIGQNSFVKSTALALVNKNPKDPDIARAILMWNKITVVRDGKSEKVVSKNLSDRRKYEVRLYYSSE